MGEKNTSQLIFLYKLVVVWEKKIKILSWQAVKKPLLIKTICVHLNLLAGLATVFSGVFPAPVYIPQRVKLTDNCCLDNIYPAPYTPRVSRRLYVIHSQHYSCDEHFVS